MKPHYVGMATTVYNSSFEYYTQIEGQTNEGENAAGVLVDLIILY